MRAAQPVHAPLTWGLASLGALLVLSLSGGCASAPKVPDVSLDKITLAQPVPDAPKPVQIVEIPQPLPLPGQLKPLTTQSEGVHQGDSSEVSSGQQSVTQANAAARVEPVKSGYLNAIQVWPYSPGALYQVYTSPGRVTDITLESGEELRDISTADTVRWVIGDTESGEGPTKSVHIAVKPTRAGLHSNLTLYTSRRTYFVELSSTPEAWMASVSWEYPSEHLLALKALNHERESTQPLAESIPLDQLQFRYAMTGDTPPWRPERAFDDGSHVYIQFPAGIAQGEMPPLFILGPTGDAQLVNYRVRPPYYIVDRLFGAAELRLGAQHSQRVRITRTDIPATGKLRDHAR